MKTAPYRICCGKQHYGVKCPDGLVMCCLCFTRVPESELNETSDGRKENVCKRCAAEESVQIINRQDACSGRQSAPCDDSVGETNAKGSSTESRP